jgi:hypothetical protein
MAHGQSCYGADGSADVDALSEGFAGGVKELALDRASAPARHPDRRDAHGPALCSRAPGRRVRQLIGQRHRVVPGMKQNSL